MTNDIFALAIFIFVFIIASIGYLSRQWTKEVDKNIKEAADRASDARKAQDYDRRIREREFGQRLERLYHKNHEPTLEDEIRANYQQFMEYYGYTEPQLKSAFFYDEKPKNDEKPKREWHVGDDGEICYDDE